MTSTNEALEATMRIAREQEAIRQERETFDAEMRRKERWTLLRLVMGWVSVPALFVLGGFAGWILTNHTEFEPRIILMAASALLIDSLGLLIYVWKAVWTTEA